MGEAGADVVGVDWRVPLDEAARRVGPGRALQGNLDPALLLAPWPVIEERARDVLDRGRAAEGHVFNLGHGVLPEHRPRRACPPGRLRARRVGERGGRARPPAPLSPRPGSSSRWPGSARLAAGPGAATAGSPPRRGRPARRRTAAPRPARSSSQVVAWPRPAPAGGQAAQEAAPVARVMAVVHRGVRLGAEQQQRDRRVAGLPVQGPLLGLQRLQGRLVAGDLLLHLEQPADRPGPLQQPPELGDRVLLGGDAAGHVGHLLGDVGGLLLSEVSRPSRASWLSAAP